MSKKDLAAKTNRLLSDIVAFRTYAKYLPHLSRRESLTETINRNKEMHLSKHPKLAKNIENVYKSVHDLKVMPSMRSMQFGGEAILKNNVRLYNCSGLHMNNPKSFGESLFLLLSGVGAGFSVQDRHISQLPSIKIPQEEGVFIIHDSIQGWADSVDRLIEAYMYGRIRPQFDFSHIRPKGSYLVTTGAKAPGPVPLRKMLEMLEEVLRQSVGRQLKSIEVYDIVCIIADCVLAGGIRRAATICLFDADDNDMLNSKTGEWWNKHPYRARSNNSVLLDRNISKEEFTKVFDITKNSGSGEPGFSWTDDKEMVFNPCFTGDTPLLTKDGYRTFKELEGKKDLEIVNHKGEIHKGSVWSNGVKDIVAVKNRVGETVRCTADHRFMLNNKEECLASDLQGKRLMPFIDLNNKNNEYTKLGFIQGDGSLTRLRSVRHLGLEVHIGKKDKEIGLLFDVDYSENKSAYYLNGFNDTLRELGFSEESLPNREFPSTYSSWSNDNKLSFLRGMYSANGSVIKVGRVAYKTTCKQLADELLSELSEFGILGYITTNKTKEVKFANGSYICLESYDVNISKYNSIKRFAKLIGFVHEYKTHNMIDILINKSPVISSVKPCGKEEVFDFNLQDDTHWGIVGEGYIAHNCHEISLETNQFCNLTTMNVTGVKSEKEFLRRVKAATILGTIQATYTDFPFLRPIWKETTEDGALLGISMTGIADNANGTIPKEWLKSGAELAIEVNVKYAKKLGINPAHRLTAIKPEGSASCVLGSSSGIHDRHSEYYIRRVRMSKDDALYKYLQMVMPELCEDDKFSESGGVVSIPQMSPKDSVKREDSSAIDLLQRAIHFNRHWVSNGHISGGNKNNVSLTVSVKDEEWDGVCDYMYKNRKLYSGISLLPYDGGTYVQAPFEEINELTFTEMYAKIGEIDLTKVLEDQDNTDKSSIISCSGGICELQI